MTTRRLVLPTTEQHAVLLLRALRDMQVALRRLVGDVRLSTESINTASAEIAYIPVNTVPVTDVHVAKSLLRLHDLLDEDDDVQQVFSNEEIDDATLAAASASSKPGCDSSRSRRLVAA